MFHSKSFFSFAAENILLDNNSLNTKKETHGRILEAGCQLFQHFPDECNLIQPKTLLLLTFVGVHNTPREENP